MGKWRRHSLEFRKQAVEKMKTTGNLHELARELGIERKLLYSWKYRFEARPEKNHADCSANRAPDTEETRLRHENQGLKELPGEKAAEPDFFAAATRGMKRDGHAPEQVAIPRLRRNPGADRRQGKLTVDGMRRLAEVNRTGHYRNLREWRPEVEDVEVRAASRSLPESGQTDETDRREPLPSGRLVCL